MLYKATVIKDIADMFLVKACWGPAGVEYSHTTNHFPHTS